MRKLIAWPLDYCVISLSFFLLYNEHLSGDFVIASIIVVLQTASAEMVIRGEKNASPHHLWNCITSKWGNWDMKINRAQFHSWWPWLLAPSKWPVMEWDFICLGLLGIDFLGPRAKCYSPNKLGVLQSKAVVSTL